MSLALGASAVWVGTRFICATEAGAPPHHQQAVLSADYHDTVRTLVSQKRSGKKKTPLTLFFSSVQVFTGRPLRVKKNAYIKEWETTRREEQERLLSQGIVPVQHDIDAASAGELKNVDPQMVAEGRPLLMGQVFGCGLVCCSLLSKNRSLAQSRTSSPPKKSLTTW